MKIIDNYIKNIVQESRESPDNIHVVLFSDHGMSPVNQYLNILEILTNIPVKIGKDFFVFLDSTMARFWFLNPEARTCIIKVLSDITVGHILDEDELRQLHIDELGREHGDLIFTVEEGTVINPDFFRRHDTPKGMHGYAFQSDNPILLVFSPQNNPISENEKMMEMTDIMPIVSNLLNIQTS